MISVDQALEIILGTIQVMGLERVAILDSLDRVLGEDIHAPYSIPPWDNSAMDGYAVIHKDIEGASRQHPAMLTVIADLPAGYPAQKAIARGEAIRIMTGAPIPQGCDTVVMVEDTEAVQNLVKIFNAPAPGQHIRRAGEDVVKGSLVLSRGSIIHPAAVGMLSSLKRSVVSVFQRPRVAVISTGDELIDVDGELAPGKIVGSNTYSLASLVKDAGAQPLILGIARDNPEDLRAVFRAAMTADVIISSGGVSVGDYDLVKDMLRELGAEMKFWKVNMRPGQPLAFGVIQGKPTFGLPGNPVSCMISFEQFVRPAIRKASGHTRLFLPLIEARLKETVRKKEGKRYFLRCSISVKNGGYTVTTTGEQGSGILLSMVKADGLIILPETKSECAAGTMVKVQVLNRDFEWSEKAAYE
jgi:molybdopterin molybdotransferase